MLVLTRRVNESIVIPGLAITVHVLAIRGNNVRIGVEAPRDVVVLRHELHEPPVPPPTPSLV